MSPSGKVSFDYSSLLVNISLFLYLLPEGLGLDTGLYCTLYDLICDPTFCFEDWPISLELPGNLCIFLINTDFNILT